MNENNQFPQPAEEELDVLTEFKDGMPELVPEPASAEDILLEETLNAVLEEVPPAEAEALPTEEIPEDILASADAILQELPADETSQPDVLVAPQVRDELVAADTAMFSVGLTQPGEPAPEYAPPAEEPFRDSDFKEAFGDGEAFDQVFHTPAKEEEPIPHKIRPTRKGRPKRKKGDGLLGIPHLLVTAVWLIIIVAIGVSLGKMIWVCAADVLAFGRESKVVSVTIDSDDTIDDITDKLHRAGLIRYKQLFKLYADLSKAEEDITTGTFELNTLYDYHALVAMMSPRSGNRQTTEVMIPEGYNCGQIFQLLEENKVCTVEDLEAYAVDGELSEFWFLEGLERGNKYCLEGYLFPDTYEFYVNSTPREALEKMLKGFDYRFTEDLYAVLPLLNERLTDMMRSKGCSEEFIAESQLTLHGLVTVASMIEEETASTTESSSIASVIYNRLTNKNAYDRYLGIDATIIYALGQHKEALTAEDLAIDSPYNTRKYPGLTPGPISNPGLNSLKAALEPLDTDYNYYVLDPSTGVHKFSKTLEEHEKFIESLKKDEDE